MSLGRREEAALICREPLATCEASRESRRANRNTPTAQPEHQLSRTSAQPDISSAEQQSAENSNPRATAPRQRPRVQTERTAANDPDDHQSALSSPARCSRVECGSSAAVAHARVRVGPHRRAAAPRGASVVRGLQLAPASGCARWKRSTTLPCLRRRQARRGLSTVAQPRATARLYSRSQRRRRSRAGKHAPLPPPARAGWLEGPGGPPKCSSTLARVLHLGHRATFSAVDFGRGALKRRKHRIREPVISSCQLSAAAPGQGACSPNTRSSFDGKVRAVAVPRERLPQRDRQSAAAGAGNPSPEQPNIRRSEQPPPGEVAEKLTRSRLGPRRAKTRRSNRNRNSPQSRSSMQRPPRSLPGHFSR
jgi:hypothetical protein